MSFVGSSIGIQLLKILGTQKKTEAVKKAKKNVSNGFIHYLVNKIFLTPAILVFTLMNKAPVIPPITPSIIAPGIVYNVLTS